MGEMGEQTRQTPGTGDVVESKPLLAPEEIQSREAQAAANLPPADRQEVERSAGEGMVGTPVEAAMVPTSRVAGEVGLETLDGRPLRRVQADLQIIQPTWSGTLSIPPGEADLSISAPYCLRLDDGRRLRVMVTARTGDIYTVEGVDPAGAST